MAALAALVVVGFTAWRLIANLRTLARALANLSNQLAPGLTKLEQEANAAAEKAAQLQARSPQGRQQGQR